MKIPKLFKKAAAFVMAAVTALSIMPATAFAAGDIGTISFSHTYDSNGNAMRYNSSANIGGYTAGGTGNYKYRMFVDGENAFCIQPGVPLKTGNTLKKASSDTWNALSANQKKAVGLALLYGYQGNRNNLSGSDDEKWLATQTLVWEFVTGCREATGSYNQTSTTVYSLHFGSNYANSGARAVYDQIVAMLREHNTIPSFMSGGKNDITKELAYKDGKYSITLNDSNGVLSDYSFLSSDSNVSVSKSGNKLTISSTVAISGSVRITAKRNNVPTVSSSAKLIAYGDPNLQDLVTGVENADTVSAYINIETPTGTIALKKTSEDGVVEGISFTIKGDNFNKTVKTGKDGSVSVEGLFPGTYTVTEQSIDRYEPQKTQTVTLIGGKTSTVTFSNTLKRGSLEIVKTSEDNLVEEMKFHLYGTSLSGLPVDEYAVTDKNGLAKFENVLISGDTPYVVEEVDTAVRYVVPASQTAPIEWNKVTKRSFDNVLKKFQVTVTKTDGDAFVQAFGDAAPVYRCVALVINAVCPSVTGMKPQVEFVSALANHQPSVDSGMLHSSCSAFSFVMVFQNRRLSIHQFLYLLILLDGYDWLVCALNLNILQITVIFDFLLLQEIRRIFLVVGYDAAVKGIAKHFRNVRCKPPFLSQRRQPSRFLKFVLDGCYSHSTQVHIINHSHRLCLFGVDDHLLADTVVSEDIPIAVEHTVLHRGLLSSFYTDGCFAALVLCKGCHDRKPQFTVAVKGFDVVVEEKHLNTVFLQQPSVLKGIHRVSRKTGNLTGNNHIELLLPCILNHFHKLRTLLSRSSRNTFINILCGQSPVRSCRQNWLIPVKLVTES